jgi:dimethylhistidine N-methyltransferase
MDQFYKDVITGLTSNPKYLHPKYFYDEEGDKIFQKIMKLPEYYLTGCELEIFKTRCKEIVEIFKRFDSGFDLIELGAGDALKSSELLRCLLSEKMDFTYYPTDISDHVVSIVENKLPKEFPDLRIKGLTGEFFDTLAQATQISDKPKVILFLGSNIGNMSPDEAQTFCADLRKHLSKGDMALIGFDLKKNPWVIFKAYNDESGVTRDFNLNLLRRINGELNADFKPDKFDHYEMYDPETGACKSYLISLSKQQVNIDEHAIYFYENEPIFMETSQKYTIKQTDELAKRSGFRTLIYLFDSKRWFTDTIWECI